MKTLELFFSFSFFFVQGLKGVENVFTQHTCWLKEILDDVFKGRTIDPLYPCFGSEPFR